MIYHDEISHHLNPYLLTIDNELGLELSLIDIFHIIGVFRAEEFLQILIVSEDLIHLDRIVPILSGDNLLAGHDGIIIRGMLRDVLVSGVLSPSRLITHVVRRGDHLVHRDIVELGAGAV